MPLDDPIKRRIATKALLEYKVCRNCGARNPMSAEKCRRCKSYNLRPKHAKLVKK